MGNFYFLLHNLLACATNSLRLHGNLQSTMTAGDRRHLQSPCARVSGWLL